MTDQRGGRKDRGVGVAWSGSAGRRTVGMNLRVAQNGHGRPCGSYRRVWTHCCVHTSTSSFCRGGGHGQSPRATSTPRAQVWACRGHSPAEGPRGPLGGLANPAAGQETHHVGPQQLQRTVRTGSPRPARGVATVTRGRGHRKRTPWPKLGRADRGDTDGVHCNPTCKVTTHAPTPM